MAYPSYLIHYNKNHSKKNGQFISGDGDGDGTADEHHRYSKNGVKDSKTDIKISKTLSKYTGSEGKKNLEKDGFYTVASKLSDEYSKRYGFKTGKYTQEATKKYDKKMRDLDKEYVKKYEEKGKSWSSYQDADKEIDKWYSESYNKIAKEDAIDYGRAWCKDLGINESDADIINKFLGNY